MATKKDVIPFPVKPRDSKEAPEVDPSSIATPATRASESPPPAKIKISLTPQQEFDRLEANLAAYMPNQKLDVVKRAYEFASSCHGTQNRQSGEPYITHPLAVANILTELKVDLASVVAAILHDVVEDTSTTVEDVERNFGKVVADLVDGLTKISKIEFRSSQQRMAENFRKMVLAMAKDVRVILVKLADRLHNMRTIEALAPAKRIRIAQETLDIYAPLASRLGIYSFKSELEDLCLKNIKYEAYREISRKVAAKKAEREAYITEVKTVLENEMKKYGFQNAVVYGRPKHFYSIYKKMLERSLLYEDVNDLFAFRIIVDSVKDCYEALGIVHAMWKPMPGRFKDYIAMPKANMYQSLHTTVIRPNGEPIEIQIRTHKMHEICEFGVAAHWAYKEKESPEGNNPDMQMFSWLRQMMQWQSELKDPDEFMEAVKVDLFEEEIFVFTPKGDVIQLPLGATALDFAFNVHTNVGLHCVGTKVNGRMVPIKRPLASGDIVEILTSPQQNPSKDWVNFVITSKARNKIRSFLRSEQRDRSKKIGTDLLEGELQSRGMSLDKLIRAGDSEVLARAAKESQLDDVLIAIGYGQVNPKDLLEKIYPTPKEPELPSAGTVALPAIGKRNQKGILISGLDNVMVNIARCCNPLPGEDAVGFITRGRGVTVHRASCARALDMDPRRKLDVQWTTDEHQGTYVAWIKVIAQDKPGVLALVTSAISECGANIRKAQIQTTQDAKGLLEFELGINGLSQLQAVIRKVEGIPLVINVERKSTVKDSQHRGND